MQLGIHDAQEVLGSLEAGHRKLGTPLPPALKLWHKARVTFLGSRAASKELLPSEHL